MAAKQNQNKLTEEFVKYLRINDLRVTGERLLIAELVGKKREHFDADTIAHELHAKGISRASVYRTLALLEKGALINRTMHHDGRSFYEHVFRYQVHGHLTCSNCGRVETFTDGVIKDLRERVCARRGFDPTQFSINLKGWCHKCRHKDRKKKA